MFTKEENKTQEVHLATTLAPDAERMQPIDNTRLGGSRWKMPADDGVEGKMLSGSNSGQTLKEVEDVLLECALAFEGRRSWLDVTAISLDRSKLFDATG